MAKCPFCETDLLPVKLTNLVLYVCPGDSKSMKDTFIPITHFVSDHCMSADECRKLEIYLYHNNYDIERNKCFYGSSNNYEYAKTNGYEEWSHISPEIVENWYPKTFAQRVDYILLSLAKMSQYVGDVILLPPRYMNTILFIESICDTDNADWRNEISFVLQYLASKYIKSEEIETMSANWEMFKKYGVFYQELFSMTLTAEAYERIYELQRHQVNNKDVFVAMTFHPSANDIRVAIKNAIDQAGYSSLMMDEIVHNHQIVPEMLRLIRESKFLIMDISQPNFGAYYEAGYALGLGKEIIVTCNQDIWNNENYKCDIGGECHYKKVATKPHFDIAQKQVLVWQDYADLTRQLTQWIKAINN